MLRSLETGQQTTESNRLVGSSRRRSGKVCCWVGVAIASRDWACDGACDNRFKNIRSAFAQLEHSQRGYPVVFAPAMHCRRANP